MRKRPVASNPETAKSDSKWQFWVAVIGAFSAITVAYLGYVGTKNVPNSAITYTGTVKNQAGQPVTAGTATITEDQSVPQKLPLDSEGVFTVRLSKKSQTISLVVDAPGYKDYRRLVPPSRTGSEPITLVAMGPDGNTIPAPNGKPEPGAFQPNRVLLNETVTLFANGAITVLFQNLQDTVRLSIETPQNVFPSVDVDVNANGIVDPGVDTYYGLTETGQACAGFLVSATASTRCGQFQSSAALQFTRLDTVNKTIWTIPKSEIQQHPETFIQFVVVFSSPGAPAWAFPSLPFNSPARVFW
jgi:hypothetical protein